MAPRLRLHMQPVPRPTTTAPAWAGESGTTTNGSVVVKFEIYLLIQASGVIVNGLLKYQPPTESTHAAVSITVSG